MCFTPPVAATLGRRRRLSGEPPATEPPPPYSPHGRQSIPTHGQRRRRHDRRRQPHFDHLTSPPPPPCEPDSGAGKLPPACPTSRSRPPCRDGEIEPGPDPRRGRSRRRWPIIVFRPPELSGVIPATTPPAAVDHHRDRTPLGETNILSPVPTSEVTPIVAGVVPTSGGRRRLSRLFPANWRPNLVGHHPHHVPHPPRRRSRPAAATGAPPSAISGKRAPAAPATRLPASLPVCPFTSPASRLPVCCPHPRSARLPAHLFAPLFASVPAASVSPRPPSQPNPVAIFADPDRVGSARLGLVHPVDSPAYFGPFSLVSRLISVIRVSLHSS